MRGFIAILSFFLLFLNSFGQDSTLYLKSFVKQDTIQLRWAPMTASVLQAGLNKGFEIRRTNGGETKIFKIEALSKRKNQLLNSADEFMIGMIDYVDEFAKTTNDQYIDMAFSLLTLSSSSIPEVAQITGVYFEDIKPSKGKYTYTVTIAGSKEKSNTIEVNTEKLSENPECTELFGESRIDLKEVYMYWEAAELNADYGGYYIYKSEDNKTFTKLNDVALYHFTSQYEKEKTIIDYVDTSVVEGNTYYYRVQPINHFADEGEVSNTVEVYIQRTLSGLCIIDTVNSTDFNREIVGLYEGEESDQIVEYILYRADKIDSVYTVLEAVKSDGTDFTFDYKANLLSGDRHYFKVAAVSVDGDTVLSYPYYHFSLDQEPPGVPTLLEGLIDTNGIVRLKWTKPEDADLRGYRVFRANSLSEEFVEVTTRLSLIEGYNDTLSLNTLTNEVYYQVNAIDQNYNNGPLTEPILLMKPDTIPPMAGVIRKYKVSKAGVYLEWSNSNSKDLKHQYLIRTNKNVTDTILTFVTEHDTILDFTGKVGANYGYALVAEDLSGNTKVSQALNIKYEIGYRPAPLFTNVAADVDAKLIKLEWEPIEEEIYSIQIYKAKADGKFRLYETIRENVNSFEDNKLNINNEYHYKIKVMYKSGISSKMSEKQSVMY